MQGMLQRVWEEHKAPLTQDMRLVFLAYFAGRDQSTDATKKVSCCKNRRSTVELHRRFPSVKLTGL
jgi:hypothetical protein